MNDLYRNGSTYKMYIHGLGTKGDASHLRGGPFNYSNDLNIILAIQRMLLLEKDLYLTIFSVSFIRTFMMPKLLIDVEPDNCSLLWK